jgi:hypothetical protein
MPNIPEADRCIAADLAVVTGLAIERVELRRTRETCGWATVGLPGVELVLRVIATPDRGRPLRVVAPISVDEHGVTRAAFTLHQDLKQRIEAAIAARWAETPIQATTRGQR